jgi:hypothetical protein
MKPQKDDEKTRVKDRRIHAAINALVDSIHQVNDPYKTAILNAVRELDECIYDYNNTPGQGFFSEAQLKGWSELLTVIQIDPRDLYAHDPWADNSR